MRPPPILIFSQGTKTTLITQILIVTGGRRSMLKALDVANFFVELANGTAEECMTNLRINKFLYYAQAWSLVRFNKPLFEEEIQAWDYGPVVPSVYHTFKPCGYDRIKDIATDYSLEKFSPEQIELLLDVARYYGQYSSNKLIDMTHEKGGPWEEVYKIGVPCITISKERMKNYFSKKELTSFTFTYNPETDVVGYRDTDGVLVLPKEYDDEAE